MHFHFKKNKASRRALSQLLHMSYFMNPPQVTPRKAAIKVPVGTGLGDILKFLRRVPKGSIYGLFRLELWSSLYRFLKGHLQYQCWFSQATVLNCTSLKSVSSSNLHWINVCLAVPYSSVIPDSVVLSVSLHCTQLKQKCLQHSSMLEQNCFNSCHT